MQFLQLDQCTQLCGNIEKKYPDLAEEIVLIKAVMLSRQNKNSEAIDILKKFIYQQERPSAKLNCTLLAVKFLLLQVSQSLMTIIIEIIFQLYISVI